MTHLWARIKTMVTDRDYDPESDPIVTNAHETVSRAKEERERLHDTINRKGTGFFLGDALIIERKREGPRTHD